jgi:hypothetical protein
LLGFRQSSEASLRASPAPLPALIINWRKLGSDWKVASEIILSVPPLIVTRLHALENNNLRRGIASLCIGGGEATAIAVERLINQKRYFEQPDPNQERARQS